jgi:hypothetical protein
MPLDEFARLSALSVSTLRLRVDYLPRSQQLLVSAARSGLSRVDNDLHLVHVDESLTEPAANLGMRWIETYLESGSVPLAATCALWRADWGIVN